MSAPDWMAAAQAFEAGDLAELGRVAAKTEAERAQPPAYRSSPTKRRRTKADMDAIRMALVATLAEDHPMSVRQVFYRLTAQGVVDKTEAEYKGTVCRLLAEMRRSGAIPYHWLADSTRWMRRPRTFSSMEEALRRTASTYRRALWDDAPVCVEIWLEKEALAGVLVEVTDEWDVPLMVTRGYASISFLYAAGEAIRERSDNGQRTAIYYFGDRDPSGVDIDRQIRQGIGESMDTPAIPDDFTAADLVNLQRGQQHLGHTVARRDAEELEDVFDEHATFTRVAVTEAQIGEWDLPTRPTKKTDSRAKGFDAQSVEVDAIPSHQLRALAQEAIEGHVDHRQLDVLRTYEDEERRGLLELTVALERGGGQR
jgi:hypothetical protein